MSRGAARYVQQQQYWFSKLKSILIGVFGSFMTGGGIGLQILKNNMGSAS